MYNIPDRLPMRASGGYGAWGDPKAAALKFGMSCSRSNACAVHCHDHGTAWSSRLPPPRLLSTARRSAASIWPPRPEVSSNLPNKPRRRAGRLVTQSWFLTANREICIWHVQAFELARDASIPTSPRKTRSRLRQFGVSARGGDAWRSSMAGNRQVWLKSRPNGVPQAENFDIRDSDVPSIAEGEFLVQNHYLSSDPAARGWIADASNYWPRIEIGDTMRAFAVGEVVESRNPHYAVGDKLMGLFGWQEYAAASDRHVNLRIAPSDLPLSLYLGVLGLNGFTAYFGLLDVGEPKAGDTVVVSTAAGAVGSCVGQIAKIKGCRTLGIAGGPEKARQCLEEFGYDAAIDYKDEGDLDEALRRACPDGVHVYFDNTSGPISDAVLRNLALGARVVICGTASYPSWNPWNAGPRPERHLLVKRARMQGFLATDFMSRFPEAESQISQWIREGRVKYREDMHNGLEHAPGSLQRLYKGENTGKFVIRLPTARTLRNPLLRPSGEF
jgi:NADPH-dependent curcumin reductase